MLSIRSRSAVSDGGGDTTLEGQTRASKKPRALQSPKRPKQDPAPGKSGKTKKPKPKKTARGK
jgi:hypothetical protein